MTEGAIDEEEGDETKKKKSLKRMYVDKTVVKESIRMLQKVNGFPETGEVSKEMLEFVKAPRCGVSDVEYTTVEDKDLEKRCFTLFKNEAAFGPAADEDFSCYGLNNAHVQSNCGSLPLSSVTDFIQDDQPYSLEIDLKVYNRQNISYSNCNNIIPDTTSCHHFI